MLTKTTHNVIWIVLCTALSTSDFSAVAAPATCSVTTAQNPVQQNAQLGSEFSVLSWNIQKGNNAGWAEDLAHFSKDVDLAFIQEASKQAGIAQVAGDDFYASFAAGYTTSDVASGVLTLSASSPSAHCALTTLEPWLGTPKATGITAYPLQDHDDGLLTINLHAINFDLGLDSFSAQFDALRETLANHLGPIILAGDLNTWSGERQIMVDEFLTEYGLASVNFEPDLRSRAFGRALDHIYIRGLQANNAEVLPVTSSDHNALRVTLGVL